MDNTCFLLIDVMTNKKASQQTDQSTAPYCIPKEPGKKTAWLLAGVMHALLFLFLWIGVHWQSEEPVGVEAEIWDRTVRQAAAAPEVSPPPPKVVQPKLPEPVIQKTVQPDPDIALERAKEKKAAEKKQLEEQQKKQELAKIAEQKKAEAIAQQQREANLKRLTSQIASAGISGDALKSTGNNRIDPSYAGKIAAKIKSNMAYVGPDMAASNPTVDFSIDLFPDGSLRGPPRKTKSSGVVAFDDAVERAIIKSAPYPADKSGNVPATIPLTYRLKENE
jgi:colicin import membrane protein